MHNAHHNTREQQALSGQSPSADNRADSRRVVDAEVLGPDEDAHNRHYSRFRQEAGDSQGFKQTFGPRFGQTSGPASGQIFGQVWSMNGQRACTGPAVGFFLFLLCLVQFGLLAAIGFAVFLGIGSLVTGMLQLRLMMQGRDPMPWLWRVGNWLACYGLTAWLAGARG